MRRRPDDDDGVAMPSPAAASWRRSHLHVQTQRSIGASSLSHNALPTPSAESPPSTGEAVFFALDTPMTPEGSPPADAPTRLPLSEHSVSASANSTNSCKSRFAAGATAFCRLNVVQRILSAAVLVPLVTSFLWRSPAFATATFCACVMSLCSYEYAWLAHRIHTRILEKVAKFEADSELSPTTRTSTARPREMNNSIGTSSRSGNSSINSNNNNRRGCSNNRSSHSTRSESMADDALCRQASQVDHEPSPTSNISSYNKNTRPSVSTSQSPAAIMADVDAQPSPVPATSFSIVDDDIYLLDVEASQCAVSGIATKYFGGNEWLAALVLSCFSTTGMSTAFLICAPWIPELENTELYRLRWFYAITTDYVASLSALFTPNWKYAAICLVEKAVFTLLTLHSTICPINQFGCGLSMEPAQVFLSGVVLILLFRLHTRRHEGSQTMNAMGMFLHIVLDMLGFLYIVGSLSVIVAFVDDEQLEAYRKLLIVLLYVVWASDTGAYLTGKLLASLHYKYYNPLAAHLSKNKDYEGTLGAILFGVATMHFASKLLDVQGSTLAKVTFTVLAVVAGRIGDLFESLLKRAAGVKDSGRLIPGHGGMLDRIDALMFASLVFARYYAMIVVPGMASSNKGAAPQG
ncbi:hypothetical protein Gpo141_00006245 [Globisporangium polare]